MALWNWYNHLMGNNISLFIGMVIVFLIYNWWENKEARWKANNNFGIGKKILKGILIALGLIFGLPGVIIFFGSI